MTNWQQNYIPCKPWNSVKPKNNCRGCNKRNKCVKRDRLKEYQKLGYWI